MATLSSVADRRAPSGGETAVFSGKGPRWRDYRRGATLTFDKGTDPKYIELQIRDDTRGQQPEFRVKEW